MSTPPSEQPPAQNKPRKKRPVDVVSFEDLLAAHKTERGPGQLPAEGVVLIGVDFELQRRMAERIALQANSQAPGEHLSERGGALNFGAHDGHQTSNSLAKSDQGDAVKVGAPFFGSVAPTLSSPSDVSPNLVSSPIGGARDFSAPKFDVRALLVRRTPSKTYVVHPVSRIEDVFTSAERDLLRWLWEKGRPIPTTPKIRLV